MIRRPGVEEAGEGQTSDRIDVVLNWFEELRERVPAE